jgi:Ser-tRNA(Ala) deacylase AlaX
MTRKLFWEDPYRAELVTQVAAVEGDDITLDATIFYALSGGQESDAGSIAGRRVLGARKDGRDIVYRLEPGHGLASGQPVTVRIDWPRRHRLMRLHLAAEIVLELTYRSLPGIEKIGAHIAEDRARIDFKWDASIAPVLPAVAGEAMALIAADHPVVSAFSDEAAQGRYWEIKGFARVPCGGTHIRRTGEIGAMSLRRVNPGKGKERVEIRLA